MPGSASFRNAGVQGESSSELGVFIFTTSSARPLRPFRMSPVRLKLARYPLQPQMNCGEASWALRTPETEASSKGKRGPYKRTSQEGDTKCLTDDHQLILGTKQARGQAGALHLEQMLEGDELPPSSNQRALDISSLSSSAEL